MRVLSLLVLLDLMHVQCVTKDILYIKPSCQMTYKIKDTLSVTVHDVGHVCPKRGITSNIRQAPNDKFLNYNINVKQTDEGRDIELDWKHSKCYKEYYILVEVSFFPDFLLHNEQRRCLHVVVTHSSNKETDDRIYFNCLSVRSRKIGTLTINNNKHVAKNPCGRKSVSENITFNLGHNMNETSAAVFTVDSCLMIEIDKLCSRYDSYNRSSVTLYDKDFCMLGTYDASHIKGDRKPMEMMLPVFGNGTYYIKVSLECNIHGEIGWRVFELQEYVKNANACLKYNTTMPSNCLNNTSIPPKEPVKKSLTQIYTMITVAATIVTAITIVTVVFIHTQRQTSRIRQSSRTTCNPENATEMNLLNT